MKHLCRFHSFPSSRGSSVQILGRHEQLQTQLARDLRLGAVAALAALLVVVEILDHFFQHHAVHVLEVADSRDGFGEVAYIIFKLNFWGV